eukprot:1037745-Pelagomonas_calceolata.AAC.1
MVTAQPDCSMRTAPCTPPGCFLHRWALSMMEYVPLTFDAAMIVRAGEAGGLSWRNDPFDESYHHSLHFSLRLHCSLHHQGSEHVVSVRCRCTRAKDALAGAGRPVNLVGAVTSSALGNFATKMKCLK